MCVRVFVCVPVCVCTWVHVWMWVCIHCGFHVIPMHIMYLQTKPLAALRSRLEGTEPVKTSTTSCYNPQGFFIHWFIFLQCVETCGQAERWNHARNRKCYKFKMTLCSTRVKIKAVIFVTVKPIACEWKVKGYITLDISGSGRPLVLSQKNWK